MDEIGSKELADENDSKDKKELSLFDLKKKSKTSTLFNSKENLNLRR